MPVALVAALVVVALVVSTVGGWFVVMGVLRLAARSGDAGAPGGDSRRPPAHARGVAQDPASHPVITPLALSDGPEGLGARAVLRGGTWVGALERLAVTGCMLIGQPEGIAVVIAVKGLGRYPELRENPGASERFVIGTLASLLWSAAVGYGTALLIA
ncbi:hypothetical protein [Cellulomonas sp. URHB0016]